MLRAYLYLSVFIPVTALFAVSASIFTLFDSSGGAYAFHARLWARFGLALNNTPAELRGAEHLPDGPFILMSNHQSNFDILSLIALIPRRVYWIAKKELFDIPIFGPSMRRGGYIPLDRSDGRKALKSMENAAAIIRQGSSVVMFPEGTRSRDGQLLPFKRGGFMLAEHGGGAVNGIDDARRGARMHRRTVCDAKTCDCEGGEESAPPRTRTQPLVRRPDCLRHSGLPQGCGTTSATPSTNRRTLPPRGIAPKESRP